MKSVASQGDVDGGIAALPVRLTYSGAGACSRTLGPPY